jgi:hypothetical protein
MCSTFMHVNARGLDIPPICVSIHLIVQGYLQAYLSLSLPVKA